MTGFWPYAGVTALAVALDQWIKRLVENGLPMQEPVDVLPFIALFRTYNEGVAFSMLSSLGEWGLIVLSLLVAAFVLYLATRTQSNQVWARLGFALIIGGAIGNLIDRVAYGHVIDYMLFYTETWSFAVFNLADACITVGAGFVILEEFLTWRRGRASEARD